MAKYEYWITEEGLLEIEGWARDGLTDRQISHNIGVSEQTLNNWKKKYPSIFESLKKGKAVVDRQVENALLKNALGYKYTEEMVTNKGEVVEVKKYAPPNTTAQIFWLKNRKPKEWRDKRETEVSGGMNVKTSNPYDELSVDELRKLAAKYGED
ncbi:helix-turn-helix domain-containing protein [Facklamia sp. P12955]|uniref:helix-turn-helix domain-containing protein n=1 Tax=Facklamia sp. P12955 TaxID=3421946 RepID=UPI003D168F72